MPSFTRAAGAALLALSALPSAQGHTWIEQMRNINAEGSYVGEAGYPRGFVDKAAPGYNGETSMVYMLPPLQQQPPVINATNLLCHPEQRKQVQSDNFPRLQATPGGWVALRYAENGHISNPSPLNDHVPGELDAGRRPNGGSVFVYGTTEPKEDETIANVLRWTKDGQGGDKKGKLLAVQDYDDGRCYELNPVTKPRQEQFPNAAMGAEVGPFPLYCESDVQLPKEVDTETFTLYWVWQWPKDPKAPTPDPIYPKGKDEYYVTCMDVDMVDTVQQTATMQFGLLQQDGMETAVKDFRNRKALIMDAAEGNIGPIPELDGGNNGEKPSATGSPAPPQTTFATSISAPFLNSTMTAAPTPTMPANDNVIMVTVTERITVTAPAVTGTPIGTATGTPTLIPTGAASSTPGAQKKRHVARYGAKFRGMSYRD